MEDKSQDISRALEILATMDVPELRVTKRDWRWLDRNVSVRNSEHPEHAEFKLLIRRIIRGQK